MLFCTSLVQQQHADVVPSPKNISDNTGDCKLDEKEILNDCYTRYDGLSVAAEDYLEIHDNFFLLLAKSNRCASCVLPMMKKEPHNER